LIESISECMRNDDVVEESRHNFSGLQHQATFTNVTWRTASPM